ncbi:Shedu anti-phage system protein SduA domain-containing protein [Streptomyces sp. BBFR2]|uniref:Shedu anti-phage system protein SduA domain-containing protein n=1 Tax=Streptomyces sp. BBFR2 TaxID=3372854 RepID=UPI0037DA1279
MTRLALTESLLTWRYPRLDLPARQRVAAFCRAFMTEGADAALGSPKWAAKPLLGDRGRIQPMFSVRLDHTMRAHLLQPAQPAGPHVLVDVHDRHPVIDWVDRYVAEAATAPTVELLSTSEALDPTVETLGLAMVDGRLRLVSLQMDGSVRLPSAPGIAHDLLNIVTPSLTALTRELEDLINDPRVREANLQRFFEQNPDFLLNDAYVRAIPQLVLPLSGGRSLRPDFALTPSNPADLCDLLDLKLPQHQLLAGIDSRIHLSAKVMDAVGQMRTYRNYFNDERRREAVHATYGLHFFRPRVIVVIGQRKVVDPIQLREAESDVPGLTLITYDDILERARRRVRRRSPLTEHR